MLRVARVPHARYVLRARSRSAHPRSQRRPVVAERGQLELVLGELGAAKAGEELGEALWPCHDVGDVRLGGDPLAPPQEGVR